MIDESTLNIYRAALIAVANQNGGEVLIRAPDETPAGTIMSRWEPEGVRLKFVPDGAPN